MEALQKNNDITINEDIVRQTKTKSYDIRIEKFFCQLKKQKVTFLLDLYHQNLNTVVKEFKSQP